ncbi:hypothetical protein [Kitasatospora camelliae]|uniref:CBM6 domain-containing protein n=1 Tax=Kitasatospora camelliae TaxID=3156397 RepID=A0AAU8K0X9_9ACTN
MTTAGSNGAPEGAGDDDPFAYLYRPAEGEAAPTQQRSPYSRPMEVGRAQYGQRPAPAAPTYPQQQPGQAPPAAVPQQTRYAERSRPQPGEDRPSGGRGKAAVIGAVAVVAAVAIGAGIALSGQDKGDKTTGSGGQTASAPASPGASASPGGSASASAPTLSSGVTDATKLQAQNAPSGNTVKGAVSADGSYLTLQAGSTVTWTVTVPTAGPYNLHLHFNNAGGDVPATVTVNGQPHPGGWVLKNYSKGSADPAKSWFKSWITPQLQAGPNTVVLTVPSGPILVDQVALTDGSTTTYPGAS